MEISVNNVATSIVTIFILGWLWRTINWLWLRPKRLERCLIKQGFRGNTYKVLHGDTKDISSMVMENNSKPMEGFSNDYIHRVFPFHHQTIQKYGENSFIWEGPIPTILVTKPELIREILNKVYDFQKTIPNPLVKQLSNGLTRHEGHRWAQDRKLINAAFHMEKLKHMLPAFYQSFNNMIQEWKNETSKIGSQEIEIWSYLHNLAADAISRAAFGSSFQEGRKIFELLREYALILIPALDLVYIPGSRYLPTKRNKKATQIIREVEALLKDMILRRQKSMNVGEKVDDDLLGHLLRSSLCNDKQVNIKLSLKEVIEECKLFYVAGQETTSSLLAWTLILLNKHQDWQEHAREEILSTFGYNTPDFDGLNRLKKVTMILQEVLRLYPLVPTFTRQVYHDVTIDGKVLPSGVQFQLPVLLVHQDERLWGPDAKKFNPERFSQGILKATRGSICFFSFGWGPRICVASNFAMMEVKMGLSMILQHFRLDLSPLYVHAPTTSRGTLRPKFGANLVLHPLYGLVRCMDLFELFDVWTCSRQMLRFNSDNVQHNQQFDITKLPLCTLKIYNSKTDKYVISCLYINQI